MSTSDKKTISVVLADPHVQERAAIRLLLQQDKGVNVVAEASSISDTIARVSELHPDLLIMAIGTPLRKHVNAIKAAKSASSEIKILVVSPDDAEAYVYSTFSAGASGYVLKESLEKDLTRALRRMSKGSIFLSAPLSLLDIETYRKKTNKTPLEQ